MPPPLRTQGTLQKRGQEEFQSFLKSVGHAKERCQVPESTDMDFHICSKSPYLFEPLSKIFLFTMMRGTNQVITTVIPKTPSSHTLGQDFPLVTTP